MIDKNLTSSKRILLALQEARKKIEILERYRSEPIAVIGMGCRFPGADTPDAFWHLLHNARHAIRNIPPNRFSGTDLYDDNPDAPGKIYIQKGGFLDQVDQFDPYFFRISPREAEGLDPQQRLTLEVSWEALQHARQDHSTLAGSRTGVFMGMGQNDYACLKLNSGDLSRIDAYDGSGNLSCFAPGRLGYLLGTHGPNLLVDTACSSSLVALHLACQSLRHQECDMALAGGVHLVLSPEITVFLCRTGVLSPDGLCKTFDAAANGFARGEGCGMLVLKRLSDARAVNDNILAVILGSAINHDGRSSGLTVPNETAQADLIRAACTNAGVSPDDIHYVEAHGTGTSLGDPIEVAGLASVFGNQRSRPLVVGSVKTNIGHLEAAAGVAGVIKTILALQHGVIPAHLHFKTPNPYINWDALSMEVPRTSCPWPDDLPRQIAGVSAFGMSGTNAHVILESSPQMGSLARAGIINPGYQRERYWVEPPPERSDSFAGKAFFNAHPLIGQSLPMPGEMRFEARLTQTHPSYIQDHLVFKKTVVPGASHLTAVLTAALKVYASESLILEDVLFQTPLVLEADGGRIVRVIFKPFTDGPMSFVLISSQDGEQWLEHVTGRVRPGEDKKPAPQGAGIIEDDPAREMSADMFYRHLLTAGFDLGPAFQWGENFKADVHTAFCRLRPMVSQAGSQDYPIHPGMLDTCFQLLSSFWETRPKDLAGQPHLFVPFSIDRLAFWQAPDRNCRHQCRATALTDEVNAGNLVLWDDKGRVVLDVEGFRFRKADKAAFKGKGGDAMADAFYHLLWEPFQADPAPDGIPNGAPRAESGRNITPRTLLIFSDAGSQDMITALEDRGYVCIQVSRADRFEMVNEHRFTLNPQISGQFELLFNVVCKTWGAEHQTLDQVVDQIIWLWGTVESGQIMDDGCVAALGLIQALLKYDCPRAPLLTLVTRVGWALEKDRQRPVPVSAPFWGMGRSVMREHPDFPLRMVDLDPAATRDHGECLGKILDAGDTGRQIAFVQTRRMEAMPAKLDVKFPEHRSWNVPAEATYLITGGFGGLGLALARLLVAEGARNIVLCGRSLPFDDKDAASGNHSPKTLELIRELEEKGTRIVARACDVTDEFQVKKLFKEIDETLPPLRGVFHAAGIVQDAAVLNLTASAVTGVMAPKIMGAWHLHKLTQQKNLDYFVLFSSMASLFGSAGQANYAAANSFLDGLAQFRQSLGLPALSINWGPFRDVGMAARLGPDQSGSWQTMGVEAISSETGMNILFQLMQGSHVQVGVFPGDRSVITQLFHLNRLHDRPDHSLGHSSGDASEYTDSGELITELLSVSAGQRSELLTRHIKKRVAAVLKIDSPDRIEPRARLFDAGLDSLMAVALKKALDKDLGQKLHTTLVFDYPTVEALAGFIQDHVLKDKNLFPAANDATQDHLSKDLSEENGTPKSAVVLDNVAEMSDDDVLAALRQGK